MGHGAISVFTATMSSGGTLTSEVDFGNRQWEKVYLAVPSMASNTQLHIQVCTESGGTYRRVKHPMINSSTVSTPNDFAIASAATNCYVPIPNGFRFLKIESTATVDGGASFKMVCGD